jgi:protein SCO1/2
MVAVAAVGCDRTSSSNTAERKSAPDFVARPGALRFSIAGRVVSTDTATQHITIAHDEIPNFMKAMTMPFAVKEAWVTTAVKRGSVVTGTLIVDGARTWIEQVVVADPGAQALPPDAEPAPRP